MSEIIRDISVLWLSKNEYTAEATLTEHSHDYYQIHCITKGSARFVLDGHEIVLKKGMTLLVKPGVTHAITNAKESGHDSLVMVEIKFAVNDLQLNQKILKLPQYIFKNTDIQQEIERIYTEGEKQELFCFEILTSLLLSVLYQFLRAGYKVINPLADISVQDSIVKNITAFIHENYNKNVSLDMIAEHVGYSKNYLCKVFREQCNMTINELLNQVRIDKSVELLLNTDMELIDIATEVGYNNIYHFIKIFKKYIGVPPGSYRRSELAGTKLVDGKVLYEHVFFKTGVVHKDQSPSLKNK